MAGALDVDRQVLSSATEDLDARLKDLAASLKVDGTILRILAADSQQEVEKIILDRLCPKLHIDPEEMSILLSLLHCRDKTEALSAAKLLFSHVNFDGLPAETFGQLPQIAFAAMCLFDRNYAPLMRLLQDQNRAGIDGAIAPLTTGLLAQLLVLMPKLEVSHDGLTLPSQVSSEQVLCIVEALLDSGLVPRLASVEGDDSAHRCKEVVSDVFLLATSNDHAEIVAKLKNIIRVSGLDAGSETMEDHLDLVAAFAKLAALFRADRSLNIRCGDYSFVSRAVELDTEVEATISKPIADAVASRLPAEHRQVFSRTLCEALTLGCFACGEFDVNTFGILDKSDYFEDSNAEVVLMCLMNNEHDFILDRCIPSCPFPSPFPFLPLSLSFPFPSPFPPPIPLFCPPLAVNSEGVIVLTPALSPLPPQHVLYGHLVRPDWKQEQIDAGLAAATSPSGRGSSRGHANTRAGTRWVLAARGAE